MEDYQGLEALIRGVEGQPFSAVQKKVQLRIEAILEEANCLRKQPQETSLSPLSSFSEEEKQILIWGYYNAIQQYRDAAPRKLGGPYFLHPDLVFKKALAAGVTDISTLLTTLYHDVIEEKIATAIRKGYEPKKRTRKLNKEQVLIKEYRLELSQDISSGIFSLGFATGYAMQMASDVTEVVGLLSRQQHEEYYQSIGRVFAQRQKVAPENIERAIIVKFCDRLANMEDLERSTTAARRRDSIGVDLLIAAWDARITGDVPLAQELRERILFQTKELARQHPEKEKGEFTGDQRLYQCFKNIVLINRYTERELMEKKPIPTVSRLHLAKATRQEAQIILNHLCTYHCGDDILNPEKVYEIYQLHLDYERQGGYKKVTRAGTHIFDGLLQRFFDAKVRGNNDALHALYENRYMMCIAALAFRHIADQYIQDPKYYLVGLTQRGLQPHASLDKQKYNGHAINS